MLSDIENAIVQRLQSGLGNMVQEVKMNNADSDSSDWNNMITVPAVWVQFGGAKVISKNLARRHYQYTATFNVKCLTSDVISMSAEQTDIAPQINSNKLMYAVLRLLAGQQLDKKLNSHGLVPQNISALQKKTSQGNVLNIMEIEFTATSEFTGLEDSRFPEETKNIKNADYIFTQYQGELSNPYDNLMTIKSRIYNPKNNASINNDIEFEQEDTCIQ